MREEIQWSLHSRFNVLSLFVLKADFSWHAAKQEYIPFHQQEESSSLKDENMGKDSVFKTFKLTEVCQAPDNF